MAIDSVVVDVQLVGDLFVSKAFCLEFLDFSQKSIALCSPAFLDFVRHVFCVRTQEQMFRVYASRPITPVEDMKVSHRADVEFVSELVCSGIHSMPWFRTEVKTAISIAYFWPSAVNATVWSRLATLQEPSNLSVAVPLPKYEEFYVVFDLANRKTPYITKH